MVPACHIFEKNKARGRSNGQVWTRLRVGFAKVQPRNPLKAVATVGSSFSPGAKCRCRREKRRNIEADVPLATQVSTCWCTKTASFDRRCYATNVAGKGPCSRLFAESQRPEEDGNKKINWRRKKMTKPAHPLYINTTVARRSALCSRDHVRGRVIFSPLFFLVIKFRSGFTTTISAMPKIGTCRWSTYERL